MKDLINNKKLWPYSVDDIIPPVLHIPLGLTQVLWDNFEELVEAYQMSVMRKGISEKMLCCWVRKIKVYLGNKNLSPRDQRNYLMN